MSGVEGEDREVLRAVARYGGTATSVLLARATGLSRQGAVAAAYRLSRDGLLTIRRGSGGPFYEVTGDGRELLDERAVAYLLVEVSQDRAREAAEEIAQGTDGVKAVWDRGFTVAWDGRSR